MGMEAPHTPSGSPVSGFPQPVAADGEVIRAEPCRSTSTPQTESSSLDHSETSETESPIRAFLKESGIKPVLKIGLWDSLAVKFRHSGWKPIREKIHASMIRTGQSESRITAFCCCGAGTWLQRREFTGVDGNQRMEYRICGSSCHDRLCTPCANTRSARLQLALKSIMQGASKLSFITLTLAGKDEGLAEKVDRLYKHFRYLRMHPIWDSVRGGAAFLEVKWSDKAQRWHPHLHLICDADFIDQGELSSVWRGITKDSFIVDIRRVKDIDVASHYVTKYASKPLNMSFANTPALLDEALLCLKGRRLAFCFGNWYGTALDFDSDELLDEAEFNAPEWENYLPLETLLECTNSGDQECRQLLMMGGGEVRWRLMLSG